MDLPLIILLAAAALIALGLAALLAGDTRARLIGIALEIGILAFLAVSCLAIVHLVTQGAVDRQLLAWNGLGLAIRLDAVSLPLMVLVAFVGWIVLRYARIAERLPRPIGRADSHFWGRQVARRIERLARFVPGASCLTQALALQLVLGRAGHASQIQIGVKKDDAGAFTAHAWVTCNDRIVLGQRGTHLADFKRLAELG